MSSERNRTCLRKLSNVSPDQTVGVKGMVVSQLNDIFARTLSGDYDDDALWEAVRTLHRMGSPEVFEYAAEWCISQSPLKRARGADVLAQLW